MKVFVCCKIDFWQYYQLFSTYFCVAILAQVLYFKFENIYLHFYTAFYVFNGLLCFFADLSVLLFACFYCILGC